MQEPKVPSKEQIAFVKEVCQEHHAELVSYVSGRLRAVGVPGDRRRIAEELMQNVYVRLLRRKVSTQIRAPIGYLKTSALREFLRYMSLRQRDPIRPAERDEGVIQAGCHERSTEDENVARLDALQPAIARLPPMERQVFTMMLEGMSERKVVDALGISRSALAKARRMLHKSINDVIHGRVRK
jgi:DNA-directed RNA polymerase specialized sigma24 family protein